MQCLFMTNSINATIAVNLTRIMKEMGVKKVDLANGIETSTGQISDLFSGNNRWNEDWLERVCSLLKIEPWMLFTNPITQPSTSDIELLSRYHAADPKIQKAIRDLLDME